MRQERCFQRISDIEVTPESYQCKNIWNSAGISPHLRSRQINSTWSWWIGKAARVIREVERLNYKKGTKRIILHNLENQRRQGPRLSFSFMYLLVFVLPVLIHL